MKIEGMDRLIPRLIKPLIGFVAFQVAVCVADLALPPDLTRAKAASAVALDHNGAWLRALPVEGGTWRIRADLDRTDPGFIKHLLKIEDERFWWHQGVDAVAIVRAFGSNRDGGARKHAAADLYRSKGDPIKAVTSGTVIRNTYFFYQGTYAIEVKHSGGFVVRYGELTGSSPTRQNQAVSVGQTVGYMGKTTCCTPMLHFELYSGKATGPLKGGGKYQRRSDLLNPTSYLKQWQANSFSKVE